MDVDDEASNVSIINNSTALETPPYEFSDYTQRVLVATMFLIIFVVGITGNSLVILAVLLSKKLRTTTNAFVVNLSVADLLTCLALPIDAVALLSTNVAGLGFVCGVAHTILGTTVICSIYTLAAVSLNRLLMIARPITAYRAIYTPKKIAVWLALAWLVPFLVEFVPPLLGIGAVGFSPKYHFCAAITTYPGYGIYMALRVMISYPVPLITIIVCYALIWRHLARHAKRMMTTTKTRSNSSSAEAKSKSTLNRQSRTRPSTVSGPRMNQRQNEITKNMFFIVCAFFVCITPLSICMLYAKSNPVTPYAAVIMFFNSCINPFIYATKHPHFKTVLGCIIRRQWDRIPEPSDLLNAVRHSQR